MLVSGCGGWVGWRGKGNTYSGWDVLSAEDGARGRYDARTDSYDAVGESKTFFDDGSLDLCQLWFE